MKAGLSTIQQTLTPEAATVLNQSIAEASRRNHGQTTPLHVAATLLSSPSGFLRQACIRSHPNSSHPLQCRALELCFSVALERLPTTTTTASGGAAAAEPPISNALMAALKRAQAHQRRGCPEQNQQPLLAIKVELEQLIISILDDPSVSRVMREASFSSPAVKATIEQLLNNSNSGNRHHNHHHHHHLVSSNPPQPPHEAYKLGLCSPLDTAAPFPPPKVVGSGGGTGIGNSRLLSSTASQLSQASLIPNRSMYLNPRLQQPQEEGLVSQLPQSTGIPNRNMYLNPRLQQQQGGVLGQLGNQRDEQVKKVVDIMLRSKKRNPVLVGEVEPEAVVKELFRRAENGEGPLQNVQVITFDKDIVLDKSKMHSKITDLEGLIESRLVNGSVIIDLGDLKWLVEQPLNFVVAACAASAGVQQQQQQMVSEAGRAAVVEMGKLLARFRENSNNYSCWFIGTATCETYLRSQVYHPTLENDWDLQAVPIASRSPQPGMFPRLGTDRILGNPVEPLIPMKSFPSALPTLSSRLSENLSPARKLNCCTQCSEKYEEELGNLTKEFENSNAKSEATRPPLPQWLQNAKIQDNHANGSDKSESKDKELLLKQKSQELQKKWRNTCLRLHPNFHQSNGSERTASPALSLTSLHNPNLDGNQPLRPKLQATRNVDETPRLNTNPVTLRASEHAGSPPGSPVKTDLVLGQKVTDPTPEKTNEVLVKDFLGCISSEPRTKLLDKFANSLDADTYKKLLKGLMEKAWWQAEAASAVASAFTRCRLGNGKRQGAGSRGDIWLLFTGPDRIGKRMMASALAEQTCAGSPVMINLGLRRDNEEVDMTFRGKTALDRLAEAVRRNPFSVIMLEDIDEADLLVRGSINRAIDRGRLVDSHSREISLGNVIFIVTGNWSTVNYENHGTGIDDRSLGTLRNGNWGLKLIFSEKSSKRRASWLHDEDRSTKPRKEINTGLSLDLNLAVDVEDDRTDGSHSSSDLTIDHEEELGLDDRQFAIITVPHELVNSVDDAIVFKPVDFAFVRREIRKTITKKFSMVVEDKISLQVEDSVLEKIKGGLWHGKTSLERWVEKVLAPTFDELSLRLESLRDGLIVQLALDPDTDSDSCKGDRLPSEIRIMLD